MKLSPNYTLQEMTRSATAARLHIDNTPTNKEVERLIVLCCQLLQPLRDRIGGPIIITSGYRCPKLNKAVGGAKNSYHLMGMAADLRVPGKAMADVYATILLDLRYLDQAIYERKGGAQWLHVQWSHAPRHRYFSIIK